MKKYALYLVIIVSAISFVSCEGSYVVTERPAEVYYTRPVAPGAEYVWVGGDWVWIGGRYQWHEGHWDRRRGERHWQDGHWNQGHGGWRWERGHWRK